VHLRRSFVHWPIVGWLVAGSVPTAFAVFAVGTALGLALTGLVLALGGGDRGSAPQVVAGYHDAITFLALVALVAASLLGREPPAVRPPVPDKTVPG
jgi:hypothetical protein